METLKCEMIKSEAQYDKYCDLLEELLYSSSESKAVNDEIELLTLLIEKWNEEHYPFEKLTPAVANAKKKKLKGASDFGVRVIRDKSLDKLSDVDWSPEKTKQANEVVAKLKWNI